MKTAKVKKPYPEYPLFAHASNQWAKKIKGRMWYFGTLDDPDAALAKYDEQVHEIQAGRDPRRTKKQISAAELSVYEMCNLYLARQQTRIKLGEVSNRHEPQSMNLFLGRRKDSQVLDSIHPAIGKVFLAEEHLDAERREEYEMLFVSFFETPAFGSARQE